jgi:dTDP-4-amino-4,6-dideoxygalactose transaminase
VTSTSCLALLGGPKTLTLPGPHFTWPPITDDTEKAVVEQLRTAVSIYDRSGVIASLEEDLAAFHGVKHALLTSSGTAALHSMYAACGVRAGDEVIVPAYTFFATVTPLFHLGAVPVLADCDVDGNLDPDDAASRITHRTAAIVVTHMWGKPAQGIRLREIADTHSLLLLEDGSHAHGARVTGRRVGDFGHAAAFSLNGPKPLSAGEGGFLLTNDNQTYHRALIHGQYNKRCRTEIPHEDPLAAYATTGQGLKLRIHPLAAAIVAEQLPHLDSWLDARQRCADRMNKIFAEVPGLTPPRSVHGVRPSWYGYIVRYQPEALDGLTLDRYFAALVAEGAIEADRPGSTCPLNLLPLFRNPRALFPDLSRAKAYYRGDFPRAEAFHESIVKLPVWHTAEGIDLAARYGQAFQKISAHYDELLP